MQETPKALQPLLMALACGAPQIGKDCYIAPTANIIGDVKIGDRCTVWFNTTIRGDVMPIEIGNETNIQDNSVIHGTYKKSGTKISKRVSIGHGVIMHGCTIGDRVLIGMGSIIMDDAVIPNDCFVGAGSLVTKGVEFPSGVLILGRPAKVARQLNQDELKFLNQSADNYLFYKNWYSKENETTQDNQPERT